MKLLRERTPSGIVILTINRPAVRNALDWETQYLFRDTMRELVADPTVRGLMVTGAGTKAFCAGGDLKELANYPTEEDGARLAAVMGEALELIETAPFISIAAINGDALGGGSEIAIACDLRIISSTARMGFVQAKHGLTPGWGGGQRLLQLLGYARAMELLLTASILPAYNVWRVGLVNYIVSPKEVKSESLKAVGCFTGLRPEPVASIKRLLRYGILLPEDEARVAERAEFPKLWAGEAHKAAIEAFLNRKR